MALEHERNEILFVDVCGAEEALPLVDLLSTIERPTINISRCTHMHAAVLQTLVAYKPSLSAGPTDTFLQRWILPILAPADGSA